MIDGATDLYGLFGHPVSHSLSPAIYNEFFAQFGMNKVYVPLEVTQESFELVLRALKRLRFFGFNVTSPYKETIASQLDRLEGVAAEIGCVNTVVRDGDSWIGINTDGEGLCRWLETSAATRPSKHHIVVLGAGNAARAVIRALLERRPKSLTVVNRRWAKFDDPFFRRYEGQAAYVGMDRNPQRGPFERASLVINVTSYGLGGRPEAEGFPMLAALPEDALVVDTNYSRDGRTAFLGQVPEGLASYDGRGMLLYLAREAFRAWTGKDPDLERISRLMQLSPLP